MLRRYAVFLVLVCVGCLVAFELRSPDDPNRFNPEQAERARANLVRMAANAAALDSARTALVKVSARTLTSATRYLKIRDSVFVPVTHAETVAVLDKLPRLLAEGDSLHAACTALVESCAVFRVRAESSLAGLRVDRDLWKGVAESRKPSRWAGVREWAIRSGIAFVAYKVGGGR